MTKKGKHTVLFICLGNICRSPAGEGIMKSLVEKAGLKDEFEIDSAGQPHAEMWRRTRI